MDDLISRQEVIDLLKQMRKDGNMVPWEGKDVFARIRKLPPAQLSTNLAEVGTDLISRQALLDKFEPWLKVKDYNDGELNMLKAILYEIRFMRSAQPEIIRCRECKFASGDSRICMKFDHSPIGELDFCSFAERREVNHESN